MRKEIKNILQSLNNQNLLVSSLGRQAINILDGQEGVNPFIDNLKKEITLGYDLHGDHRPFYYFYLSIGHLALRDYDKAKDPLSKAVEGFRIGGFSLNEALGEWLFALIHVENGNNIRARQACETAISIFTQLITLCKEKAHYNDAKKYTKQLGQLEKLLKEIKKSPPVEKHGANNPEIPYTSPEEDYIVLPWLPLYDSVQAGKNGPIWANPPTENGSTIRTVEIDGELCEIFSLLSSSKAPDHQVTLNSRMDYGWARVRGHSMNAYSPVTIEEGDYVLFTRMWRQDLDAIVIASRSLTDSEQTYMVKKYITKNHNLVSKTKDISEDYSPIHLSEDYKILGTIIAVAKPKK